MIAEAHEEMAALYALGMLDGDEAAAFERALAGDRELRALIRELRDAAASVARDIEQAPPPARLRETILARAAAEMLPATNVVRPRWTWAPWAAAATLAICCGLLGVREGKLREEVAALRNAAGFTAPVTRLEQISFCEMELTAPPAKPTPRAAVAWDPKRREGLLRLSHLDPAANGKDYQLWVVEDGVKDPVNAGVVHVSGEGDAATIFKPAGEDARRALAFALSVEKAGGVPKNEGPILLLGKL